MYDRTELVVATDYSITKNLRWTCQSEDEQVYFPQENGLAREGSRCQLEYQSDNSTYDDELPSELQSLDILWIPKIVSRLVQIQPLQLLPLSDELFVVDHEAAPKPLLKRFRGTASNLPYCSCIRCPTPEVASATSVKVLLSSREYVTI